MNNNTLWMSNSEALGHFFLGGITIFVYTYAIFLCSAIYDYQNEKPNDEKCPLDHQLKGSTISKPFLAQHPIHSNCLLQFTY